MSRVGFELTTPVFERAKTVHALDRMASVIVQNFIWKDLDHIPDKLLIILTEEFRDLSLLLETSAMIIP
jgi:hypothetical protein